jgi:hypothetical protein
VGAESDASKQAAGSGMTPTASSSSSSSSAGRWPAAVWGALGDLLMIVMRLFPTDPPYEFTAALKDVVCEVGQPQAAPISPAEPAAAAAGEDGAKAATPPPAPAAPPAQGMQGCSATAAVQLLWGLAVAGLLELPSWDILACALDRPGVQLDRDELRKVGCLCVHTASVLLEQGGYGTVHDALPAFTTMCLTWCHPDNSCCVFLGPGVESGCCDVSGSANSQCSSASAQAWLQACMGSLTPGDNCGTCCTSDLEHLPPASSWIMCCVSNHAPLASCPLQVFEAYSLVVLHTQGPLPRPTPPGQLSGAQESFIDQALQPVAAQRQLLLAGLQQGGALPPLVGLTGPSSGQSLLVDVLDTGELTVLLPGAPAARFPVFTSSLMSCSQGRGEAAATQRLVHSGHCSIQHTADAPPEVEQHATVPHTLCLLPHPSPA